MSSRIVITDLSTSWAANLPAEEIPKALAQIAAIQSLLAARLTTAPLPIAADDALVDAPELARRLAAPESHIRTLQRTGKIPFVRVGQR